MRRSYVFGKAISLLVISSMLFVSGCLAELELCGSKPGSRSNCFRLKESR